MRILPSIRSGPAGWVLIVVAALFASPDSLAVTMIQTGDGKGEKKPDWVELDRFVITPEIVIPKGEGSPRSGKSGAGSLSITKLMDKDGTTLHQKCCEGKTGKSVKLHLCTSNKDTDGEWIFFTLRDVVVRTFDIETQPSGDPMEVYTFDFRKLKWEWSKTAPKKSDKNPKDKWALGTPEAPHSSNAARKTDSETAQTGIRVVPRVTPKPVIQGPTTGVIPTAPQTPEAPVQTPSPPPVDPAIIEPPVTEPAPPGPTPAPSPVPPGPM